MRSRVHLVVGLWTGSIGWCRGLRWCEDCVRRWLGGSRTSGGAWLGGGGEWRVARRQWRSGSEAVGHGLEAVASGSSSIISFPRTRLCDLREPDVSSNVS
jgi:hypothetical protein